MPGLAHDCLGADVNDTMVVIFGDLTQDAKTGLTKRQYWTRQAGQWKIFFEGVIG